MPSRPTDAHRPDIAQTDPPTGPERLVVVSNRLPLSLRIDGSEWSFQRSSGGLASALDGVTRELDTTWIGWPGCVVPDSLQAEVASALEADGLAPVYLTADAEEHFYHGISNQVLWPLFHYFGSKIDFQAESWKHYVEANERFAAQIARSAPAGARVWVQDFHLMLVPRLLRELRSDVSIGFFLHIPFPSSEIYRLLPAREELLQGVLGADYVGFHTHDYARHFRSACLRVLGLDSDHDAVWCDGRRVGIGAHPIGIDVDGFDDLLAADRTREFMDELRSRYAGRRVVLGIERLDYTKGLQLKFDAFERLLERRPELAENTALVQVVVPSRLANRDYVELKGQIEQTVGRINGRYSAVGVTPVEYLHRSIPPHQLAAMYRFADVCLVSPIRDGMNLVAQEYVHCQSDAIAEYDAWRGSLVLSEFAGAAHVLPHAQLVNPWDTEGTATALEAALEMPAEERRQRGQANAAQVRALDCRAWSRRFLNRMSRAAAIARERTAVNELDAVARQRLIETFQDARQRLLFLDYDGTLREIEKIPEAAIPTPEILDIVRRLAALQQTDVHVVSGRHRSDLENWLGDTGARLAAEHGFSSRGEDGSWIEAADVDLSWLPRVQDLLLDVVEEVPGSRLERKPGSLAWHYRQADPDYGIWRARTLLSQLEQDLSGLPVEILHGHRVIEIRSHGIDKGAYVARAAASASNETWILCIGDDRTDRDMYARLPEHATCIHVGSGCDEADYRLSGPRQVRKLLNELLEEAERAAATTA